MLTFREIEYGSPEYRQMVALRDIVLRKPLGLTFSESYLEKEINDQLIGCYAVGEGTETLCGCCILTPVDQHLVQLRQMAVSTEQQGQGVGRQLITFAEQLSRDNGFRQLMLHARENARGFYEKLGYQVHGSQFFEVGIPHYEMNKDLVAL